MRYLFPFMHFYRPDRLILTVSASIDIVGFMVFEWRLTILMARKAESALPNSASQHSTLQHSTLQNSAF
ncbi:hypothetical protein [uncultured Bartonella sp.]|uniref:hypothetical protein n=1 Tax=uncultured Bartonella sp. TaxID=104108 RepID=UPI0025E40B4F|nr:hypothetical protein [uncultured Bartonella sp.]